MIQNQMGISGEPTKGIIYEDSDDGITLKYDPNTQFITFWDDEITNGTTWDGTEWPYDSLSEAVEGVTIYPISITNDALGYVLTDNNFAFMGHIIGEEIADELLSVGKHMGSFLVEEYYEMIADFVK